MGHRPAATCLGARRHTTPRRAAAPMLWVVPPSAAFCGAVQHGGFCPPGCRLVQRCVPAWATPIRPDQRPAHPTGPPPRPRGSCAIHNDAHPAPAASWAARPASRAPALRHPACAGWGFKRLLTGFGRRGAQTIEQRHRGRPFAGLFSCLRWLACSLAPPPRAASSRAKPPPRPGGDGGVLGMPAFFAAKRGARCPCALRSGVAACLFHGCYS